MYLNPLCFRHCQLVPVLWTIHFLSIYVTTASQASFCFPVCFFIFFLDLFPSSLFPQFTYRMFLPHLHTHLIESLWGLCELIFAQSFRRTPASCQMLHKYLLIKSTSALHRVIFIFMLILTFLSLQRCLPWAPCLHIELLISWLQWTSYKYLKLSCFGWKYLFKSIIVSNT